MTYWTAVNQDECKSHLRCVNAVAMPLFRVVGQLVRNLRCRQLHRVMMNPELRGNPIVFRGGRARRSTDALERVYFCGVDMYSNNPARVHVSYGRQKTCFYSLVLLIRSSAEVWFPCPSSRKGGIVFFGWLVPDHSRMILACIQSRA